MGKFWTTEEEKKRFFKYFQAVHKMAGNEIPDNEVESYFTEIQIKSENDEKLLADEKARLKLAAAYRRSHGKNFYKDDLIERMFTVMVRLEKTDADKEYNAQLIERTKTKEGLADIYKEAALDLLSLDLKLLEGTIDQQVENWKKNTHLFELAFIADGVAKHFATDVPDYEGKAEKLAQLTDNKLIYEEAGNTKNYIKYTTDDFYPYMPKNMDLMATYNAFTRKIIGATPIDKNTPDEFGRFDHQRLTEFIGFGLTYYYDPKNMGAADKKAVREVFEQGFEAFSKKYKSDKNVYEALSKLVRDAGVFVNRDISEEQKMKLSKEEKFWVDFTGSGLDILANNYGKKVSGRELYTQLMMSYAEAGGKVAASSEQERAQIKSAQIENVFNKDYKEFRKQFASEKAMQENLESFIKGMPSDLKYFDEKNKSFIANAKEQVAKAEKASKNPGKDLYDKLKGEYLKFEINIDKANVEAEYSNPENNNLKGINDSRFVDEMITLLEEGDKWYRGSSSAYKDIQSQLNDLKTLIDLRAEDKDAQVKRSIDLIMGSVLDKAQKYVKAREKNAIDYSSESYKGKRVDRMNKVINRLQEKIASVNRESIYSEKDMNSFVPSTYKKDMKALFEDNIFSSRVLAEIIAVAPLQDNKGHLGQATFKDLMDETEKIAGSPAMTVLAGYYGESKSDVKDAITKYNSVSMHMKTYFENIKSYNKAQLSEEVEKLKKIEDANTPDKISVDKFALRYDYAGKITGDRELDAEIAKFKKNFVSAMNDRRPAEKNMLNELGENKINEAGMVPVK